MSLELDAKLSIRDELVFGFLDNTDLLDKSLYNELDYAA